MDARKSDCASNTELASEALSRAARRQFRLVGLFKRSPRSFVVVEARFGRRQSPGRAQQEFDAEPILKLSH